ncbi:family 10 glycosylhydrolase [Candidatus Izimaplasma bacterium]|nr:family 10 glycosylhydrolase [Candidatus Izimaplasma bacterium]
MKLFKYTEKETPINYLDTDTQVEIPSTYNKKPFRALWVSNVVNIDLPTIENIEEYKSQVIHMLDTCIEYNLSAIIFQVRTTNDAFYESKLNPFSRYLTMSEGNKPPFDILKWIIEEATKRNLEFHAWCNPYRVSSDGKLSVEDYLATCDDLNYAKQHPEDLVLDTKGKLILNPTKPSVKKHIIDSMRELATNYKISGIHFDDYFYPYSGLDENHDDSFEFENREDKTMSLGDFRRANVNEVIKGVYHAIKEVDEHLQFGVSPFGIWKNKASDPNGSNTAPSCSESYYNQYADTVEWIKEGYIDYIVPQIYWEFGHKIAPFADICDYWVKTCQNTTVKLYIGHGAYRLGNKGEFGNKEEIINQIKYANQFDSVTGNVFFTYKTFIDKEKSYEGMQLLKQLLNEV